MSKSAETIKKRIIFSNSPLANHSLSSKNMKDSLAGEKRVRFGRDVPPSRRPREIAGIIFWERVQR